MKRLQLSRIFLVIIFLPYIIVLLHIPAIIISIQRFTVRYQMARKFSQDISSRKRNYLSRNVDIYNHEAISNITDILMKKDMGGILMEMDVYKNLMKAALEKGVQSQHVAKATNRNMTEQGLDTDSLDLIQNLYNKNITNFFHTLTMKVDTPFTAGYIINNETLCIAGNHPLTYLVYVHSAIGNSKRRVNLRKTWAKPDLFPQFPSRLVFFMGRVLKTDENKQVLLEAEATKYGDIVQVDFLDTYHNLSYKALSAMRWISEFCTNAHYIFKTDDDVYVNMPEMMLHLTTDFVLYSNFIMGMIWRFPSLHIDRPGKECFKRCIPFDVLPGLDHYPTYASGSFYITTQTVAIQLYDMGLRTPIFRVDDVFITGIVAARIPSLEHIDISKAYLFNPAVYKTSLGTSNPLIVTLSKDLVNMWKYHLPQITGLHLSLLGEENYMELLNAALEMT